MQIKIKYTPIKEKKAEWWSTKGVPLIGYAKILKHREKNKLSLKSRFKVLKTMKVENVIIKFINEAWKT